jgi:hypothetical protein
LALKNKDGSIALTRIDDSINNIFTASNPLEQLSKPEKTSPTTSPQAPTILAMATMSQ